MDKSSRLDHIVDNNIDPVSRTVWLRGDVDDGMLDLVSKACHMFCGKSIKFILSSGGGDDTAGLGIYDLIAGHSGPTEILVEGSAQSMAAIILQAARKRVIYSNSYIMVHQGEIQPGESHKKNLKSYMRISDIQDDVCDRILLSRIQKKHPKYSWAKFREETNFDVYFTAAQALQWGLVDGVI